MLLNLNLSTQILRQIRVMSAACDKTPVKLSLILQLTPDCFNFCNGVSIYGLNKIYERTPTCFTPFDTEEYSDLIFFQPVLGISLCGSNDLGLHVVEPSDNKRRLQIEITIILTVCCSSQRVFGLGSVCSG